MICCHSAAPLPPMLAIASTSALTVLILLLKLLFHSLLSDSIVPKVVELLELVNELTFFHASVNFLNQVVEG